MDNTSDIANGFQALSVLLVFNSMLFTIKYPQFLSELSEEKPELRNALDDYKKRLRMTFYSSLLPVLMLNFISAYLVSPTAWKFILNSTLSLLDFDFFKTAFVLVSCLLYIVTGWSGWIGWNYFKLIRK